jgi:2-methylcitrate dehydratase PrpD
VNVTQRIADFVAGTTADRLPDALALKMRVHLIDTLAAGISGSTTPEATRVRTAVTDELTGPSTVWGTRVRSDSRSAACANGMAAHVLELDDTGGCDHSGAVVVPAVLASQQARSGAASLGDVLVAMALGYEFARRAQFALGGYPSLNDAGWHSTAVCGPIGAAVGAAKVAGLSAVQVADAIGLASSMMAGGWSFRTGGGDNKALHPGLAAAHGVESSRLALHGVRGTKDAFQDTWGGVGRLYAGERAELEALTDGLGSRWVAFDASIKAFPSCASSHRMLQLVDEALVRRRMPLESIDRIEIRVSPLVAAMCG